MENINQELNLSNKIKDVQNKIDALRLDGETKIYVETNEINLIKNNKKLDSKTKNALIAEHKKVIEEAKQVKNKNNQQVNELIKEGIALINEEFDPKIKESKLKGKEEIAQLKANFKEKQVKAKKDYNTLIAEINSNSNEDTKNKLKTAKLEYTNVIFENKMTLKNGIQKIKDFSHKLFLDKIEAVAKLKNDKLSVSDKAKIKFENYIFNFNLKDFLMKNGLYIIIILFMIFCIIKDPNLISVNNTLNILKNFSTKVFFALGVAGLILLGGTDLSIGRMVTLGSIFTCMLLNPSSTTEFFGISFSGLYNTIGFIPTAILALLISITLCTLFSAIAGFFTAKFKIHPFITTLGTSLVIWGLVDYGTQNVKTGTVTQEALDLVRSIFKAPGFSGIPLTLIYAIIAIIVIWFIWNKTKFGKNMYAVGGNQEAASVSGISVFKVTLGVFIMAGILYGFGSFFIGLQTGSSSSVLGQGWELEAIAACVVGGISFSGGIGKISGAVIGCLLFEVLKYYLRAITGGSLGITNIFIGVIILVAVIFDSIKYLKKK